MSNRDDDPQFNEYLKRDSALSQHYKEITQDAVPPALDQKILMQAREAVSDGKVLTHPSWWVKWNKPLALAATLMLAFTVIYRVGHQSIDQLAMAPASPLPHDRIATPVNAPAIAATPLQESDAGNAQPKLSIEGERLAKQRAAPATSGRTEASALGDSGPERKRESPPVVGVPPSAKPPMPITLAEAPSPAMPAENSVASKAVGSADKRDATVVVDSIAAEEIGQVADRNVGESMQRIPGIKIERLATKGEKRKENANSDPEVQLQHIRELRQQGKSKQADKAWQQFRADFPDYIVADDDEARSKQK